MSERTFRLNVLANYVGRIVTMASAYVFAPILVRILGVEAYGLVATYTVIVTFVALVDAGLSVSFSREAARGVACEQLLHFLATAERLLLAVSGAVAFGLLFAAPYIANHWLNLDNAEAVHTATDSLRLMAVTLPFQLAFSLYIAGLTGLQRQVQSNLLQAGFVFLRLVLVLAPLSHFPDVRFFFAWQLGSAVLCTVIGRARLVKTLGFYWWRSGRFRPDIIRSIMPFAGGMMAMSLIAAINTQADKIVTGKLLPMAAFGSYSLASALAMLPYAVVAPFLVAVLPRLTFLAEQKDDLALRTLLLNVSFVVSAVAAIGSVSLFLFAPEVLALWVGRANVTTELVPTIRIMAGGSLFLAIGALPYYLSLAHGHSRTSVLLNTGLAPVMLLLLVFATSRWGMSGAAVPWLLTNFLNFAVLSVVIVRRYAPISVVRWMVDGVVVPTLAAGLVLLLGRLAVDELPLTMIGRIIGAGASGLLAAGFLALLLRCRFRPASTRRSLASSR